MEGGSLTQQKGGKRFDSSDRYNTKISVYDGSIGISNSGHLSVGRVYLWEDEGKWTSSISDHGIFSFEPMTDSECQGVYGEIEPGVTKACPGPWWGMGYGHK